MNERGLSEVIAHAQELRMEFESDAATAGSIHTFYKGIDLLDAHLKDSRYMRHRDRICEERRAYARALIRCLVAIPDGDTYLAGVCAVLLKREIDDISAHEPDAVRQLERLREKARNHKRTNLLFEALRIHNATDASEDRQRRAG